MATKKDHARAVSLLDELRQFFTGKPERGKSVSKGAVKAKKSKKVRASSGRGAKKKRKSKAAAKK